MKLYQIRKFDNNNNKLTKINEIFAKNKYILTEISHEIYLKHRRYCLTRLKMQGHHFYQRLLVRACHSRYLTNLKLSL